MDIYIMHYNYKNKYLVEIIDSIVYVYKIKFVSLIHHYSLFIQKLFLLVNRRFAL